MCSLLFREEEEAFKANGNDKKKGGLEEWKRENGNSRLFEKKEKRPKNERLREAKR